MEIETVGQLQVYLLLKKADLLEYFTKCKFKRFLWFLPLPGGHFNFLLSPVFLSGHLRTHQALMIRDRWMYIVQDVGRGPVNPGI